LASAIDASAERSRTAAFFSTLFPMAAHSTRTSESSVSIFVNSVTAFFVVLFLVFLAVVFADFMIFLPVHEIPFTPTATRAWGALPLSLAKPPLAKPWQQAPAPMSRFAENPD